MSMYNNLEAAYEEQRSCFAAERRGAQCPSLAHSPARPTHTLKCWRRGRRGGAEEESVDAQRTPDTPTVYRSRFLSNFTPVAVFMPYIFIFFFSCHMSLFIIMSYIFIIHYLPHPLNVFPDPHSLTPLKAPGFYLVLHPMYLSHYSSLFIHVFHHPPHPLHVFLDPQPDTSTAGGSWCLSSWTPVTLFLLFNYLYPFFIICHTPTPAECFPRPTQPDTSTA